MRIGIDMMGGDYAPGSVIRGAILARETLPDDVELVLIGDKEIFVGGRVKGDFIVANVRELGDYALALDTISPEIKPLNFKDGDNISGRDKLKLSISDDFSGIDGYEGYIDNQWVLFEWDSKNNTIAFIFSKGPIKDNSEHKIRLTVRDTRKNTANYEGSFFW